MNRRHQLMRIAYGLEQRARGAQPELDGRRSGKEEIQRFFVRQRHAGPVRSVSQRLKRQRPTRLSRGWGARNSGMRGTSAHLGQLDMGTLPLHMAYESSCGVPEGGAGDNVVHLPMLQQEFGGLKTIREVLANRL